MPEPTHPPYSQGAQAIPRMLNRWLDINAQNGPLTRTLSYITLPAFSVAVDWKDYSELVAAFNYEGPNNFTLKSVPVVTDPNYVLCIMWQDDAHVTHRYAFWRDVGEVFYFHAPLYTGQLIKKNFRFEIWSTDSTPAVQSSALTFYTSVRGDLDYRFGSDFTLVGTNGEVTDFSADAAYNQQTLPVGTSKSLHFVSTDFAAPNWTTIDGQSGTVSSAAASLASEPSGISYVQVTDLLTPLTGGYMSFAMRQMAMLVYIRERPNYLIAFDSGPSIAVSGDVAGGASPLGTLTLSANAVSTTMTLNGLDKLYWIVVNYLGANQVTVAAFEWDAAWNSSITAAYTPNDAYTTINILDETATLTTTHSGIVEMVNYFSLTNEEWTQVRDYFLTKYAKFTLPFVFPSDSVPATN